MRTRLFFAALILAAGALAQTKYPGPKPPEPDRPYLLHGDSLVEVDVATASQQDRKDDTLYAVAGETAKAKTPLASPVLVIDVAKINPAKLQLYRFEVKGGRREIVFRKKGRQNLQPITMSLAPIGGSLYRLEVVPSLENGEYGLSPEGSNQVFCFTVF